VHDPVIGVEWHLAQPSSVWACTKGIEEWASIDTAVGVFFILIDTNNPNVKIVQHNASKPSFPAVNFILNLVSIFNHSMYV